MPAFTAKSWPITEAPERIELRSFAERPEPAQHIIEFPGGAIEVSRCTDGSIWAHIIVNRAAPTLDGSCCQEATGIVVGSRIDTDAGIIDIPNAEGLQQIAVKIQPHRDAGVTSGVLARMFTARAKAGPARRLT